MTDLDTMFPPLHLRHGVGNGNPKDGLCLLQMVDWFSGNEKPKDTPLCVDVSLWHIAMWLNDSTNCQAQRDRLWPFVWKLIGTVDQSSRINRLAYIRIETRISIDRREGFPTGWRPGIENTIWDEHFEVLEKAINMGKHGEIDPCYAPRYDELKKILLPQD
jgi:hypothetical protein